MVSDFLYLVFHLTFNIYHLTLRPTAGRLTAEQAETAEGEESKEYGYNPFGNLISVLSQTPTPNSNSYSSSEAAYTYSYDGKRISKYIDGTLYDYTYTGNNLLETYADTAGRIAKYTYGNALISKTDATGSSESVVTDYQNSVIALLNPSTIHNPLSTAFAYDPFGKLRYTSSEGVPQTLGWLSRQYDSETGNNYLINRYYNADRGSFLGPDQYQYVNNATPFTFNLYQYGYANPLVNVDPEGLAAYIVNGRGKNENGEYVNQWEDFSYEIEGVKLYKGNIQPVGVHLNDIPTPKTRSLEFLLKNNVLVFVHGYNVNEKDAISKWTIKTYNRLKASGFKGDLVVLSWQGNEMGKLFFQKNVNNANHTTRNFAKLLQQIRVAKPNATINVAAHSLGSAVVLGGMKYAESNLGLSLRVNNLITIQAAVEWRDITVGGRYHDFGSQNPRQWYNLSSSADQSVLGVAYGASEASQTILKSSPYRVLNGILGEDISGILATMGNPIGAMAAAINWKINGGALGAMGQPHPKLDPYYNGYFGGNFPSFFRLIGTEQMGINDHSAMVDNIYRKPVTKEELAKIENLPSKRKVEVLEFWKQFLKLEQE